MENSRVLIVGAAGFLGTHLLRFLCKNPDAALFALDRAEPSPSPPQLGVTWLCGDATKVAFVERVVRDVRPTHIINLSGVFRCETFREMSRVNVGIAQNLLESVLGLNLRDTRVVLIGSAAEYGMPSKNPVAESHPACPLSPYGLTKLMQTEIGRYFHRAHGVSVIIARPFNIDGEGISPDLSVGSWRRQISEAGNGTVLRVGNLETIRDYLPVADVIDDIWTLCCFGLPGETYNVCSGRPVRMADVLQTMIAQSGKQIEISVEPQRLRPNDVHQIYGSNEKISRLKTRL